MACYFPLHAFQIGTTANGKPKFKIESGKVEQIPAQVFNSRLRYLDNKGQAIWNKNYIEIPCGKCIGCRIDYSKDWANRCMLEAKSHTNNAFLTLTYDDEHIKNVKTADRSTGESIVAGTLQPRDLTLFMKSLRKYYKEKYNHDGIRFYACGEYGGKTYRPHYHLIVFNLPIYDLKPFFKNADNEQIWLSDELRSIWRRGHVSVGEVTWQSCAYVARYVMKKRKGPGSEDYYKSLNVAPEFVRMSRRPGIAFDYFQQHKDTIYETDEIFVSDRDGKIKTAKPCKYYDRLYDLDSPEAMKAIKEQRKECAALSDALKFSKISMSKSEYLEHEEEQMQKKVMKLRREL